VKRPSNSEKPQQTRRVDEDADGIFSDASNADNINLGEADEETRNVYARSVDVGHRIDPRSQKIFIMVVLLLVIYTFGLIVPKDMINEGLHHSDYNAGYSFSWFVQDLQANMTSLMAVFTGQSIGPVSYLSTMLRYVVVALAGAGLALCGTVYQGSFRNALVSPSTLGVMSGASLGMMVWVVFFVADDGSNVAWLSGTGTASMPQLSSLADLWSSYGLALMSFAGCMAVVLLVFLTLKLAGRARRSSLMIIIIGQVIGAISGAISSTIRYYYVATDPFGAKVEMLTNLQIASFYRNFTWLDIVAVGIPLLVVFLVVMRLRQKMMMLAFEEGEARSMGVNVKRVQYAVVGLCTLLTAIIISFCGMVGFVGFLVPHLTRRLVGPNFKYLLPAATVMGAIFVLSAYLLVSMTVGPDYETMTGMFISIGGAVVFLVTALRKGGVSDGGFR